MNRLEDKLLAGFVGLSFLLSLGIVGIYLIFTGLFFCRDGGCSANIWSGLFSVSAGLLIFIITLMGKYDARGYLGR